MIPFGVANKLLKELHEITGAEIVLISASMDLITPFSSPDEKMSEEIREFIASGKAVYESEDTCLHRIPDDDGPDFVIAAYGENASMAGRIGYSELKVLSDDAKARTDKGRLLKEALLGYSSGVGAQEKIRRLKIKDKIPRRVYLAEVPQEEIDGAEDILKAFFAASGNTGLVTSLGSGCVAVAKETDKDEDPAETAVVLLTLLTEEAMIDARIAYGGVVTSFADIHKAYGEARTAMDVGGIFYPEERVVSYGNLGIGRLIYQMPPELCRVFLEETFDHDVFADMDDETLRTVEDFFKNNLNVSETARGMYIHRNTLVYRLEKLEKTTGLDIRKFDDAMTFKLAMMIELYLNHKRE